MAKTKAKRVATTGKTSSINTTSKQSPSQNGKPETGLEDAMAGMQLNTPQPFRFFDLPAELRIRIYELILLVPKTKTIDLDPLNHLILAPRLSLFLVSSRFHSETYPIFYSQPLRLFPTHGRFHHTKKPLLARLPPRYQAALTTLELRLGPDWSAPPRCQNTLTNPGLGLAECTGLRILRVFVECDPSEAVFDGFRGRGATEETYKVFCLGLLEGVFRDVRALETVEMDAYPGVRRDAPLVLALMRAVVLAGKRLRFGRLRGWDQGGEETGVVGMDEAMLGLGLGVEGRGRVVEVGA